MTAYPTGGIVIGNRFTRLVTVLLGTVLYAGPALAAPAPDPTAAVQGRIGSSGSFLLIDGGAPSGQARLTGCDRAISDLHASLDQAGAQNTVLIAPTASAMRDGLLQFGSAAAGTPHAVLFCGYATETGGNVFALGSDFASHDDPALAAVSIRAFSRVAGSKDGLVLLDLHPMVVDGAPVAAAAGALEGAANAWSDDSTLGGTRQAMTDRQPGDALLIAKAARSGSATTDGIARSVAAQGAASPTVPATGSPAAAAATTGKPVTTAGVAGTAPDVAGTAPGDTATTQASVTDGHPTPRSKDAAGGDAAVLAPKPARSGGADAGATGAAASAAGATVAANRPAAPHPRVHVDPAVRRLQVALLARGLFTGRVNGVNSADTQRAVQHFQAMLGHPVTGQLTADETKELTGG